MKELSNSRLKLAPPPEAGKPILLAEEDEETILLLYEAFKTAGIENPLFVVFDGQHTIDYLAGTGRFQNRDAYPPPCLLILSTELPDITAVEVLQWMRAQGNSVQTLPTILLAKQPKKGEMKKAIELEAYDYLPKNLTAEQFLDWAKSLKTSWFQRNSTPECSFP